MESYDVTSARADLAAARRAEAAPWIDYPPTPLWYYPAGGLWTALLMLGLSQPSGTRWVGPLDVALCFVCLAFVVWMRKHRGTMPSMSWRRSYTPVEMRRVMPLGLAAFIATAAIIALVIHFAAPLVGVIVALLLVPAVLAWYERAYANAAATARARLDSELP